MNQYQFEAIVRRMKRKFGEVKKGTEGGNALLNAMETRVRQVNKEYPDCNSLALRNALILLLYRIEEFLEARKIDVSAFEDEQSLKLRDAILPLFDPFVQGYPDSKIERIVKAFEDPAVREEYMSEPVRCIERLISSINFWCKSRGSDGYFTFLDSVGGGQGIMVLYDYSCDDLVEEVLDI